MTHTDRQGEIKPVEVNEDIWFYPTKGAFEFVVWTEVERGNKICTQFRITKKKLQKYL